MEHIGEVDCTEIIQSTSPICSMSTNKKGSQRRKQRLRVYFFRQLLQNNGKIWRDVDLLGAKNTLIFAVLHLCTVIPKPLNIGAQ